MFPYYYGCWPVCCQPSHMCCCIPKHSYVWCPVCCQPYYLCCCSTKHVTMLPQEISVTTAVPTEEALIGGTQDVKLTLEYTPDAGAADPSVTVTITGTGGQTTTWKATNIPAGYHVKNDFVSVAPGSKVQLDVVECTARLRWCEAITC